MDIEIKIIDNNVLSWRENREKDDGIITCLVFDETRKIKYKLVFIKNKNCKNDFVEKY